MPLEAVSIGFKDISLSFKRHPVTNDIASLKNEDAIKVSVINLVRTRVGERFFNSLLGSNIENSLFDILSDSIIDPIENEIKTVINNFEPRVNLKQVNIDLEYEKHLLNITIIYDIVGLAVPTQAISFILQPTRY